MKSILTALVFGLCSMAYAQTDYTFVYDSEAFLEEGIRLYDEGKYQDAIKQFDKVVKTDPNFYRAQYEKAMALAAGDDTAATAAFYEDAYNKGYLAEVEEFYMGYGNFLSDQKEYDKAEKMFLEAQKLHPESSVLLYNLGLLYVRKDERQKSVDLLQKAITLNPNHAGSHYLLGLMALEDGRVTEGTMALLAYLTIAPTGSGAENAIIKLNTKFGENFNEKSKLVFSKTGGDNFEDIDVILRNSLPLKSVYKIKSSFDDVIIRQVQAVAEYCTEHKVGNGFFETTYVPFLADIVKKNQFEGFSYYILQGMREKLGKKLTSQDKKTEAFVKNYIDKDFWDVFARRRVDLFGKQEDVVVYLKNNKPYLLGKYVNNKKEGKFKVLNGMGHTVSELNFVADEPDGVQKYYNYKGQLIEEKKFVNGKLDGKRTTYYKNGNIELVENYKNDVLEGISTSYHVNGGKNGEGSFVNGERHGTLTYWFENGVKRTEVNYANGKLNGKFTSYDKAGNIISEATYVMDKHDGKAVEYYDGKVIKSEVEYKADVVVSPYKRYYPDGTLREEIVYKDDKPISAVYNYTNGKKSYETIYDKDGGLSAYVYYDDNSEKFFEDLYKDGKLKSALQYQRGNAKPAEVPVKNTTYVMKGLDGNVLTKGNYEKDKKKGEWNYYFETGGVRTKEFYTNGLQHGITRTFEKDGRPATVVNYVNDTIHGLYENYSYNKLSSTYYYTKGDVNGPSKTYYEDGAVSSESFYIGDDLYVTYDYWQNGNLRLKTRYVDDNATLMEIYDTEGKKESEIDYTNKTGKVTTSFFNGNELHEYEMVNGVLNGKYIVKDKKGKTLIDAKYINGSRDGKYLKYGPTGALYLEIYYYAGRRNGVNKHYDLAGNLRLTDTYILGDNTGVTTRYYHNKSKFNEFTQYNENTEGEHKYYNLAGVNVLTVGYQNNQLRYYITLGKDGKLTEKVPVTAQTAKIVSKYASGKTAIEIGFTNGELDGKFAVYSQEGKPEFDADYDKGLLTGTRTEYYANGKIYKKEHFKNGNFDGLQEFFKEDGKPIIAAEYKNDELHGLCKIYTNGTVSQTQRYDTDKLVEILK